jgi:hypothetical protein
MRLPRLVFLLLMSLPALGSAAAQADNANAEMLAKRMVKLMRISDTYVEINSQCAGEKSAIAADLLEVYRSRPADFGGISPESNYWPEVERIYYRYRGAGCMAASPETIEAIYTAVYSKYMSVADLEKVIAFYETPAGARMQEAGRQLGRELATYVYAATDAATNAAPAQFKRDIADLIARYKSEHQ